MATKCFISFVEEFWEGQKDGTWIGRMEYDEIHTEGLFHNEIGIGTHDRDAVEKLREKYDFKTVSKRKFEKICREIEEINGRKQ